MHYGWSTTNITPFSQSATLLFELTKFTSLAGPSALNGIRQSKITPTHFLQHREQPAEPDAREELLLRDARFGRAAAGERQLVQQHFTMAYYHPTLSPAQRDRSTNSQAASITGYGGKDVPPYSRFYLGGEQDVRGYDFYTISPFVFIPYSTTTKVSFFNPQHSEPAGQSDA